MLMFKKIFSKFFTRSKPSDQEYFVAALEILIGSTQDDKPKLNILLDNFSEESIDGLCNILTLCASEYFFLNIVEIIKNQFLENNKQKELEKIIFHIAKLELKNQLENVQKTSTPCIKPSDIQI